MIVIDVVKKNKTIMIVTNDPLIFFYMIYANNFKCSIGFLDTFDICRRK